MDVPSRESAQTTGLDSAARTSGPRNVLGTTPGNARWSYCGGGRVSAGGAPGRGRGARARPHLLHVQPVVEQVVRGLQAEALLHLRVGAGGQVHGGHGHQQPQQPALPARAPRPLPRHPGRQLPRAPRGPSARRLRGGSQQEWGRPLQGVGSGRTHREGRSVRRPHNTSQQRPDRGRPRSGRRGNAGSGARGGGEEAGGGPRGHARKGRGSFGSGPPPPARGPARGSAR